MLNDMTLIAQISDLHIKAHGRLSYRHVDTQAALRRAIHHLNALRPRPDAVVITGDLVDFGRDDEYQTLQDLLSHLTLPFFLLAGNHDDRAALRRAFPGHDYVQTGEKINWSRRCGALNLIALDSTVPQQPQGELDSQQLHWLDEALTRQSKCPTLVMLHHPPFISGIGHMDRQCLQNPEALAAVLQRHPHVVRVLCGHIHRSMQTQFAGTLACSAPGVSHQVAFDLHENGPAHFVLEPPGYLLHRWHPLTGLVTHLCMIDAYDGPYPFYDENGLID